MVEKHEIREEYSHNEADEQQDENFPASHVTHFTNQHPQHGGRLGEKQATVLGDKRSELSRKRIYPHI